MRQVLIILRGAPGSGKSTIAKNLRNFNKKVVWLKVDNFKDFFSDISEEALDAANKTAFVTLNYLLDKGYTAIFEGIFQNPEYIQEAVNSAKQKNIPVSAYQLDCSLKTLQERDKLREGVKEGCRKLLGDDVIERLYRVIENNPFKDVIKLDTEKMSVDECIEILKKNFS